DGVPLQAFVSTVQSEVVGILIIRDEQDLQYLCARYNIESFIYFSHHRLEEHAHILHFVLAPSFQRCCRHLFKESLRLGHKSCLFHRLYPPHISPQVGAQGPSLAPQLWGLSSLCMSAQKHIH
ncbi:uncharacterized protein C20orf26-like, partial [Notothenia coriiceps]|uniref:Uncharacterized protein C20orf26-like n=1 Tax=Notothenia coriiceps TaxID=8208 RepID=A0A6I9Q7B5_9TELE